MIPEVPAAPALATAELTLQGRLLPASNATFVGVVDGVRVVYKPVAGERPLWDFPDGTLAAREVAAYLVSEALGWDVVPTTLLREGPHGPGMVQVWVDSDEAQEPVKIVTAGSLPPGHRHVLDGLDAQDRAVSLVHEDSAPLRRMALFDAVVNNADRKGGHVLPMPDGHRHGVDHGLTFHVDPKLRTVLWGWAGEPLSETDVASLAALAEDLEGDLGQRLGRLVDPDEVTATWARVRALLAEGTFPAPVATGYPVIPWPPL